MQTAHLMGMNSLTNRNNARTPKNARAKINNLISFEFGVFVLFASTSNQTRSEPLHQN